MQLPSIHIISLAAKHFEEQLRHRLQKHGHDFAYLNPEQWLQRRVDDPQGVCILILPSTDPIFAEKIMRAISATPQSNYLIIFFPPVIGEVSQVLDICDDCWAWGCGEWEFLFRLQRLLLKHEMAKRPAYTQIEKKVWTDLHLIGRSAEFQDVLGIIEKAAHCYAPVVIEGETGCGKEMVARAIHYLSGRKDYPFIPINCGAVPDHLIENELFGHEKGAYTDAKQSYAGSLEQADGGTLFLDEIEALSPKGQVTLLRFIEDKIVKPLGSIRTKTVNVRIIVASNTSLSELVDQGLFRKDLLYRLNLLYVNLPPLRKRESDIEYLAEFFMQKYREEYRQPKKQIHPTAMTWMQSYFWPGNVRELENFIHSAFLLSEDDFIRPKGQNAEVSPADSRRKLLDRRLGITVDEAFGDAKNKVISHFEKQYLSQLIARFNGNVTLAADNAHKERRALGKLLKKYDIHPAQFRNN